MNRFLNNRQYDLEEYIRNINKKMLEDGPFLPNNYGPTNKVLDTITQPINKKDTKNND